MTLNLSDNIYRIQEAILIHWYEEFQRTCQYRIIARIIGNPICGKREISAVFHELRQEFSLKEKFSQHYSTRCVANVRGQVEAVDFFITTDIILLPLLDQSVRVTTGLDLKKIIEHSY